MPRLVILAGLLVILAVLAPVSSACTSSKRSSGAISGSPSIYLSVSGIPSQYRSVVVTGAKRWNRGTNNDGGQCPDGGFPEVTTSYTGGTQRVLNAQYVPGYQPDGSADACAEFFGQNILFYQYARNEYGETVPCMRTDILEDSAAHELGHAYGLNDSGCGNYIMGKVTYGGGSYTNRTVRPAECSTLDDTHVTPQELSEATQEDDDPEDTPAGGPEESCDNRVATCTPILVDLDRGGFRLTSPAAGTVFDLDRDGIGEQLAWTTAGGGDAWLAVDRDGNGWIDDGGELFGNFTDQPASDEPNGYRALAVYDDDEDLRITSNDSVFPHLRLWLDSNQDGRSQPEELLDLDTAKVEWIGLEFVENRSRDRHGNEFRYRALVGLSVGRTHSVDVFLQSLP